MSDSTSDKKPMLADLVRAGEAQTEAIAITDFVSMAQDISNAYLVTTRDGDVMINTGFMGSVDRNKNLFEPVRKGPLHTIFLTQAHPDHYGGVPAFVEPKTQVVAGKSFVDTWHFFKMLDTYLRTRSGKIWSGTIKGRDLTVPQVIPDVGVETRQTFIIGERTFEVIATPGGESPCAVVVWLPEERIAFTGNLFGPIFGSVPNLCTMRGDKPRSAHKWLKDLENVRDLEAELLITGHGEPIRGAAAIKEQLDNMHAAVSYIHDKTVEGMNAGKDVHSLMREIQLPDNITIGEFHGKVAWAVRTIWEEYSGWFHMDSTTSLYGVPRSSINGDLVELAGGAAALAQRAAQMNSAGKPLEALHLTDIALDVEPENSAALTQKKQALETLLAQSGGQNMSETMWLKGKITATEQLLHKD